MANNIVISGICGDPQTKMELEDGKEKEKENCKTKVLAFMRQKLAMEVKDEEVVVAHRTGKVGKNLKPRPIVVRCEYSLRQRIFAYTAKLKDIQNEQGDYYYVRSQLPEPLNTEKKEREMKLKQIKKQNEAIPEEEKHKRKEVYIKNNILYINKKPQRKHVNPPNLQEVFNCDRDTEIKINKVVFSHTTEVVDKRSRFAGHAARIQNTSEIIAAYKKIKLLYPESDHIMLAYVMRDFTGAHDNGEHGAGSKNATNYVG